MRELAHGTPESSTQAFSSAIADLAPGDHLCCLYETEEEHRQVVTPFLRHGVERGEKVVYILDTHTADGVLEYLREDGLDVVPYLGRGQLVFLTQDETYTRESSFDPAHMIDLLGRETERALAEGYPALRVTGEMTWVLGGVTGSERLIEYEARLNEFLPAMACLAICQYDQRRFEASVLLDVLRTHPIALVGTGVYHNFYYIPPAELVDGKAAEVELHHWLQSLAEHQRSQETLRQRTAQLEALRQVGLEVASQLELESLLHSIVSQAVGLLGGSAGGLGIYRSDLDALDYTVYAGITSVPDDTTIRRGEGFCGRIWETGEPLIVNDYGRWEERLPQWEEHLGHRADVGVPVRWGEEVIGVLDVFADPPRTFTSADAELLSLFAIQAAIAIRNAQLYEEAQQEISERRRAVEGLKEAQDKLEGRVAERTAGLRASNEALGRQIAERRRVEEELRRANRALMTLGDCNRALVRASREVELLHSICRIIVVVGGYRLAWVGFAERDSAKTVRPVSQAGYEEGYLDMLNITWADTEMGHGPTGTAIRTERPSVCRSITTAPEFAPWRAEAIKRGYASSISLPLIGQAGALGALNIYAVEPDAFDAEEVNLLEDLADNLAYGIMALRGREHRSRAEEALRASEERYRGLFEGMPVGLYRTTPEGQILDANPALVQMLGYLNLESLLKVNVGDLYLDPEERRRWKARLESQEILQGADVQFRRRDGSVIWARDSARTVRDADGRVAFYEGHLEDITQRKEAQASMIQAERLAVAGRLAASLTHEINNPLQSVIGCLGLAQETLAEGEDAGQYIEVAREELRRAAHVVAQLRDLHRRPKLAKREPADVNALMEHVLVLSRKQCQDQGVEVDWMAEAGLPSVLLAVDQTEQVFLNLLLNALDAMPTGGRLLVTTRCTRQPLGASISFADTGTGIVPGHLPHIFEPFYSTKSEGLGMGLFVTRSVVEEHGGHIEVESQVGKGSTFEVWLPA